MLRSRALDPDSPISHLIDLDAVEAVTADPQVNQQNVVDRLLSVDRWVTDYGITLDV